MNKKLLSTTLLWTLLLSLAIPLTARTVSAAPTDLTHLTLDTIGEPMDIDPAWEYDTSSNELLMNIYDTLIKFKGGKTDEFLPNLADEWKYEDITEDMVINGKTVTTWVGKMSFHLRTDVAIYFQDDPLTDYPGEGDQLTMDDVEYSFERWVTSDYVMGPSWMIHEALIGGAYMGDWSAACDAADLHPNSTEDGAPYCPNCDAYYNAWTDEAVDAAIESGGGWIWFNMALPERDIFYQVVAQGWAGVVSKAWCTQHLGYTGGGTGQKDWPGMVEGGGDNDEWVNYHDLVSSPIYQYSPASPGPNLDCALGTGPYMLDYWDKGAGGSWSVKKSTNYWGGWLGDHVDRFTSYYIPEWATRKLRFLGGIADLTAVPRMFIDEVRTSKTGGSSAENFEQYQPGVRCDWGVWDGTKFSPYGVLSCDAIFFNTLGSLTSTRFGVMQPDGTFDSSGAPRNMFNDTEARLGFSHMLDYTTYMSAAFVNEAISPPTPIVPGLTPAPVGGWPNVGKSEDPSISQKKELGISWEAAGQDAYDRNLAVGYLKLAWGGTYTDTNLDGHWNLGETILTTGAMWNNGFTISLVYNEGNVMREMAAMMFRDELNWINTNYGTSFTGIPQSIPWSVYRTEQRNRNLPLFIIGWIADYADVHNFVHPFMHSGGAFSKRQGTKGVTEIPNQAVDDHIMAAVSTTNVAQRLGNYTWLNYAYVEQAFGMILDQPILRHFHRDWAVGWVYNPCIGAQHFAYMMHKALTTTPVPIDVSAVGTMEHYGGRVAPEEGNLASSTLYLPSTTIRVTVHRVDAGGFYLFVIGAAHTDSEGYKVVVGTDLKTIGGSGSAPINVVWPAEDTNGTLAEGDYGMSGEVYPVSPGAFDTDLTNNIVLDTGVVTAAKEYGDLDADKDTDYDDIVTFVTAYIVYWTPPVPGPLNPLCDFDKDLDIDYDDILSFVTFYIHHWAWLA